MKKILSIVLILSLAFCFCACGNKRGEVSSDTNATYSQNESQAVSTPASSTSSSTHTHTYSAATCTAPKKCSCGATEGKALGHTWQEATCKVPKTCSVCNATEGKTSNHKYSAGKCVYCGDKQKIDPSVGLKKDGYYYLTIKDDTGTDYLGIYQFYDATLFLRKSFTSNEEEKMSDETINYKGKTYFLLYEEEDEEFGQKYTLTDTEIIIKDDDPENSFEIRLIVNYQYDLEIVYSSDPSTEVGTIFDLIE